MALTGTWPRTLDDKGRLAVPKRVREDLGGMDLKSLFLAPWTEKSLAVFTPKNFETLAQRFSEKSAGKSDVRNYMPRQSNWMWIHRAAYAFPIDSRRLRSLNAKSYCWESTITWKFGMQRAGTRTLVS